MYYVVHVQGKLGDSPMGALAQKLILKMRLRFGDAASDVKGQEIITTEVMDFMTKGGTVKVRTRHLTCHQHESSAEVGCLRGYSLHRLRITITLDTYMVLLQEEDLSNLENKIRAKLTGATPP